MYFEIIARLNDYSIILVKFEKYIQRFYFYFIFRYRYVWNNYFVVRFKLYQHECCSLAANEISKNFIQDTQEKERDRDREREIQA